MTFQKEFSFSKEFAERCDDLDSLKKYRDDFLFPKDSQGNPVLYFTGNSLGLQPTSTRKYLNEELDKWADFGVEGHLDAKDPWYSYHELVTKSLSKIVGAKPSEVVAMNTLTTNLHLLLVSFYRPTAKRFKIIIEAGAFPSDRYAAISQLKFHGHDPLEGLVEITSSNGSPTLTHDEIMSTLEKYKDDAALVLIGQVNFLTGQAFDLGAIAQFTKSHGIMFGVDLAHGAGNLLLKLHEWEVDFACWCSYKYLNAGPGGIAGIFIHEKHGSNWQGPRFEGWWGFNKEKRFEMPFGFNPIGGAESWQLSNPPIFQLAALRASLEIFDQVSLYELRMKGDMLTGYLEYLIDTELRGKCKIITPKAVSQRGNQLSIEFSQDLKSFTENLKKDGVICDVRGRIVRFAPAPLYNSFMDVYQLIERVKKYV